jgi:two-component SAPR family response regulator
MEKRREHIRKKLDAFVLGSSVAIVDRATTRFREEVVDALLDGTVYSIVESLKELQVDHIFISSKGTYYY